jgi:two-component system sensor histidine kinase YesM
MSVKKIHKEQSEQNIERSSLSRAIRAVFIAITFIVTVSFMISLYFITKNEREKYAIREADTALMTLGNTIRSDINNYSEISRLIMTEDRLVTFLRAKADAVDTGMINDARYGIMDILNVKEGVDCVIVFREDLIMLATERVTYKYDTELMNDDSWREDMYAAKGKAVISLNSNSVAVKIDGTPVLSIGRAVYDIHSQKRTGLMFVNISTDVLEKDLRALDYGNICLVGTNGEYLAGNRDYYGYYSSSFDSEDVVHRDLPEGKGLLSASRISGLPIVMIRVAPYGNAGIPYGIIYVLIVLLLIFIMASVFVGAFITRTITNPIFQLSRSMEKNKRSGELKKLDVEMPYGELNMLKGDYNSMIDHVNELIDTLVDKEKTLRRAELRVLQEQIKPHFLYNSLETIGFLALDAGADNVHEALETLGAFYRNFLSKGDREISLAREVQIVKDYLSLQKLRYGDIIEDTYDIAPDTERFVVPKLILQPLVENSIYHGIRLKGEKGLISISSRMDKGSLVVTVRDTGVGMSEEQIRKVLQKNLSGDDDLNDSSFGLWGTIERIRMYCNDDDVVSISSEPGEYTEIKLIIRDMWHAADEESE